MEWPSKKLYIGQIRTFRRFAWYPRDCEDGKIRWLTMVRVHQRYQMSRGIDPYGMEDDIMEPWWVTTKVTKD